MAEARDPDDPKGLIREAYRIDGITEGECRSIYLDWALSLAQDAPATAVSARLADRYGSRAPDHPMTHVLAEGAAAAPTARRRGGWRGRKPLSER
ncbi:MAG: hypothetical protein AAFU80_20545 [Pseudomonadota bacterium]